MQIILRQFDDACGVQRKRTQIHLVDGGFSQIYRSNFEMRESRLLRREGNRRKKIAKPLKKQILGKILAPDAQVRLIRHTEHYTGMQRGAEIVAADAEEI